MRPEPRYARIGDYYPTWEVEGEAVVKLQGEVSAPSREAASRWFIETARTLLSTGKHERCSFTSYLAKGKEADIRVGCARLKAGQEGLKEEQVK